MRLLVTGHTGFKGGWLVLYAHALGHEVHGYGLSRTAGPSLYELARIRDRLASETRADVLDLVALKQALRSVEPDVVLHLAARAIVKESFADPVGTIRANVLGTTNVLEAVRTVAPETHVVAVTTDKVYRCDGRTGPYTETDELGGRDPYGGSKAAAEMIVQSYRDTYGVRVTTARSGNVIGGGDWGAHRLVPNCLKAFDAGLPAQVHDADRPFLHVLDSIRGYLMLADNPVLPTVNFGPGESYPLTEVAGYLAACLGGSFVTLGPPPGETQHLALSSELAKRALGWTPAWGLHEALDRTVAWHQAWREGSDMELVSMEQVAGYVEAAQSAEAVAA